METILETQKDNVRKLWAKACTHDGIEPSAMFVVMSDDNPFKAEYDRAMRMFLLLVQAFKHTLPTGKEKGE